MNQTNDISRLFSRFGGHPDQYQEIGRDNLARSSEARWPLLASVTRQAATMQAVRDMGAASPATELPENDAAGAGHRVFGSTFAQVHHTAEAAAPLAMPGSAGRGVSAAEDKAPLAQFIPPRRRTSPPSASAVPAPAQAPIQPPRSQPAQLHSEPRKVDQAWPARKPAPPPAAFPSRPEAVAFSAQGRPQSPLQAVFARLERAGENSGPAARAGNETPGARYSIFERLARR